MAPLEDQEKRLSNQVELTDFVDWKLDQNPAAKLTKSVIQEMHQILFKDLPVLVYDQERRYIQKKSGEFRTSAFTQLRTRQSFHQIPAYRVEYSVDELCEHVNAKPCDLKPMYDWWNLPRIIRKEMDQIVKKGVDSAFMAFYAHHRMARIHPFPDGNGRIARGVLAFLLMRDGLLNRSMIPIDYIFVQNRNRYLDALKSADRAIYLHGKKKVVQYSSYLLYMFRSLLESAEGVGDTDSVLEKNEEGGRY